MNDFKGSSAAQTAVMAQTGDEALLASLGYKQEFKRSFSPLELFGIGFSIIGLVPSIASVVVYAIPYGGAVSMVWGWAVCCIPLLCIALAMGELASAAPTSGGLYYWSYSFSSPRWRTLICWTVGYANTIGNIASVASVEWGCAVQVMAAVSIGSNMTFSPTTAQTYGVFCAIVACHIVLCSLATRVIARLQIAYIILNVLLILAIIIALPAATPAEYKNSAKYAFGNFTNSTTWPDGYAFIMSFLAPLWTICAFDASVHISEEASNASTAVPWAIVLSTSIAGILGWGIQVALTFCMGKDLESIISNAIDQPLASIFFDSFGQKGTLAIWSVVVAVQFMMGSSIMTTASRQLFAFSRDGGLPLSYYLYRINPRTRTPVNCVWFCAAAATVLTLLAFAGEAAIGAVFSLVVAAQYVAYSIPIVARFAFENNFKPGPFYLGRMSLPVAIVAVAWMSFMIIVFFFPANPGPTPDSMNYAVVVLGGVLALSWTYFYFPRYGGVHWFRGPVPNVPGEGQGYRFCNRVSGDEGLLKEKGSLNGLSGSYTKT